MIQFHRTSSRLFYSALFLACILFLPFALQKAFAQGPMMGNMKPCPGHDHYYWFLGYNWDLSHCQSVTWTIVATDKYGTPNGGIPPGTVVDHGVFGQPGSPEGNEQEHGGPWVKIHWDHPIAGSNYAMLCVKAICNGEVTEVCVPTSGDYPDNQPIEITAPTITNFTGPTNLCGDGPFEYCVTAEYTTDVYWEIPAGFHAVGSTTGLCIKIERDANSSSNAPATLVAKPHYAHSSTNPNFDCDAWGPTVTKTITSSPVLNLTRVQGCDGHCKILATVTGGVPPFTWNVVANSSSTPIGNDGRQMLYNNVPCEGTIDIQALDANGCSKVASMTMSSSQSYMNESILYRNNTTITVSDCIGTTGQRSVTVNSSYGSLSGATFDIWEKNYYDSHTNNNGWLDETLYPAQQHGNPATLPAGTYYIRITMGSCIFWQEVVVPDCNTTKGPDVPDHVYPGIRPNPNNGYFITDIPHANYESVAVEVRNQSGGLVYTYNAGMQAAGTTSINVDISSQSAGVYLVRGFINGAPTATSQTVKQ